MTDEIETAIHKVAKAICKKKGYVSPPSLSDVKITLWAILLLNEELKKK